MIPIIMSNSLPYFVLLIGTYGCTKEACSFRDALNGVHVIFMAFFQH